MEWLGSDARRRQMHGGQVGPVKVPVLGWSLRLPRWLHKPWNVLRLVRAHGDRVSCNPAPAAVFLLRRQYDTGTTAVPSLICAMQLALRRIR